VCVCVCLHVAANNPSAIQEIYHLFRNSKVYFCVHNSLPLVPILSHINPVLSV